MAMTGVLRPGHTQLRVLDMAESVDFYGRVFGMIETGCDDSGRVYFKAPEERDHHSVVLREAEKAGMDFYGFKVLDNATLDQFEKDLNDYGIATERMPAGDLLKTGERVRFKAPTGHTFELYAEKEEYGDGRGYKNPRAVLTEKTGIGPNRLDHWQIHGSDLDGSRDLFINVLGFKLVEHIVDDEGKDVAVWLTCSTKAHDIAFVRDERDDTLHHLSLELETWETVLRAADILSENKCMLDAGPMRHGITRGTTIYAFDPSGNRFETFCGGYDVYPDMKPYTWTLDEMGAAVFYHTRELNERFLTVVT